MKKIWRALTFNLSQALYPLISDLYQIFEDLASSKYVSAARIKEVSQNLYIIISAVMLFALGIKLISAIVNPDLLDDKKKGAKKTFFRSVAALFLIVLVPMAFDRMYTWQEQIVNDHVVEKLVLGMDVSENSNRPGQILAAYAFYSFCQPNENVSSESISEYYNKTITEDIYYIDDLDDAITSKTDGKWDLNYHPILSPAVGFFMVYEMVVLCMDMALRGLKLALLQLITPIILCAYVLIGDDVLQKWVKEVLSTFALVFVKIALVSFMVFGLSIIPDFFTENNLNSTVIDGDHPIKNFLKPGIIRAFILIGLLQLIKQLPEVLNKILGTNIKTRGGIRGRLGEMAGVGEMAQKAWDKIKTGVGTVAKAAGLGLGAVGALSSPLGWGALAAAGAGGSLRHQWKKGFGSSTAWKDTKVGRGLRRFGAGAKAVGTGLNTKGGIFKGISEGIKSYKDSDIGTYDVANKKDNIISKVKKSFGIGEDGRLSDVVKEMHNGNDAGATTAAIKHSKKVNDNIASNLKANHVNDDIVKLAQGVASASKDKEAADAIKSKYDSINSKLQSYIDSETNPEIQAQLRALQGNFLKGSVTSKDVVDEIGRLLGDGAKGSVNADASKLQNLLKTTISTGDAAGSTFEALLSTSGKNGAISIGTLGQEVGAMNTTFDSRKSDLDAAKESYKLDDYQKAAVDKSVDSAITTSKTVAETQAKSYVDETTVNDSTPIPQASSSTTNSSSPAPQQSTQSSRPDPYEGYGPSSTPSYGDYDGSNDYYNNGNSGGNNNGGSSDNSQGGGNTIINNNYNSGGSNDSINVKLDSSDIKDEFKNLNKSMAEMATNITNEVGKQGENISDALNDLTRSNKDIKKSVDNNTDALDDLNKDE